VSQRPRLAGDGRLLVPSKVAYDRYGFLRGRLSDRTVDPFDWTADRLLLAESFARLDLADRKTAKAWFVRHGVVDRAVFGVSFAELPEDDWRFTRSPDELADHLTDIGIEQRNVAWHLAALMRLSEARSTKEWDPSWGHLMVHGPDGELVVGGPHAGSKRSSAAIIDLVRREFADDPRHQREADADARVLAATEDWPLVDVGEPTWFAFWFRSDGAPGVVLPEDPVEKARVLGSTWDYAVELQRLLIAPYVARAVERRFSIEFEARDAEGVKRSVLVPHEERVWRSILAPIYLQLFEALRRITEGEPGAATCRECGRPFLILDARRRFFCNDRERFRYSQREHRRRLRVPDEDEDLA
jgi:hypothetical protein